jgi:hypothetical protein
MKRLCMSVLAVYILFSGCILDNDSSDKHENVSTNSLGIGAIAFRYFPMNPGTVWSYTTTTTAIQDGVTSSTTKSYITRCSTKFTILGTTYFRETDGDYSSENYNNYWYNGNDVNIIIPDYYFKTAGSFDLSQSYTLSKVAVPFHNTELDRPYYRFGEPVGTSWTIWENHWTPNSESSDAGINANDDFIDIVITGTYLGREIVSTGMGEFENCMKFEHIINENYRLTMSDETEEEGSSTTTDYYWFAPDVGMIKKSEKVTHSIGYEATIETELVSFKYTGTNESEENSTYSVTGTVVERDGTGIPGVTIVVQGEGHTFQGVTNVDGGFLIGGLSRGYYELFPSQTGIDIKPAISVFSIVASDMHVGTFLGETSSVFLVSPRYSLDIYLNFRKGAAWTYSQTEYKDSGEQYPARESLYACNGIVELEDNGEDYIDIGIGENDHEYYKQKKNGLYLYLPGIVYVAAIGKSAGVESQTEFEKTIDIRNRELLYYTFDWPAAKGWKILEASASRDSSYGNACVSGRYAGLETVETEADVYERCAKFEICLQTGARAENHKGGDMYYISGSETIIKTRWFAPNVGMVKETIERFEDGDQHQEDSDEIVFMPGEFRVESELVLKSYSNP